MDIKNIKKKNNLPTLQSGQAEQVLLIDDLSKSSTTIVSEDTSSTLPMKYDRGHIVQNSEGLYYITENKNTSSSLKEKICSPIRVVGRSRDTHHTNWCIVLEWFDKSKTLHTWSAPLELIQGDSRKYQRELTRRGLVISTEKHLKNALDFYLNNHPTENLFISTNRVGWYGNVFVMPNRIYGETNEAITYQPEKPLDHGYSEKGTLDEWRENVCSPLGAQSRLNFAISCAFSGSLLKLLSIEGGGFHLVGKSSIGKSVCLDVAASIWGDKNYVKNWNTTKNAAEVLATTYNDGCLIVDEISQAKNEDLDDMIYMFSNGRGKNRSTADGSNRMVNTWQTMVLSSGEETLKAIMSQSKKKCNAGMEVRLCHIDADAGKELGIFDSLVLASTAEKQADMLTTLTSQYHGTAGTSWLNYITRYKNLVIMEACLLIEEFMSDYDHSESQSYRVGKKIAVAAAAGELATRARITGWQDGEAIAAGKICFENWLENYGHDGKQEDRQIIGHIAGYLEKFAGSRFQTVGSRTQKISKKSGYYKQDDDLYLFGINTFEEICLPYSKNQVLDILRRHDLLRFDKDGRSSLKLNNKSIDYGRAYAVKGEIMRYDF
jgi:uncharacterized protein (DUF927 family)